MIYRRTPINDPVQKRGETLAISPRSLGRSGAPTRINSELTIKRGQAALLIQLNFLSSFARCLECKILNAPIQSIQRRARRRFNRAFIDEA